MTPRLTAARGFTLLEMLVATAMVAVLAGSLYASLSIAFKARRSALASVETVRTTGLAVGLVKADLESAVVPTGILAGAFVGRSGKAGTDSGMDELVFYAAAMDQEPSPAIGDIKKIEYACEHSEKPGDMMLVRRVTTNLLAPAVPLPRVEVICRVVRAFALRYFDGSAWQESWDSTTVGNVLPRAVEVTIELTADSAGLARQTSYVILIPCGQATDLTASSGRSP